jgi:soluble lytic murein transglycosylase-like protein
LGALIRLLALTALFVAGPAAARPVDRRGSEVAEAAARFGVPAIWIWRVIEAESNGRATWLGRPIVSRAGAMGLMQLMPGTWRDMRAAHGLGPDPHDPHDNILAGTAYLRAMYDRFGYPGVFAAYNAGPARYAADLASKRQLPAETLTYVAKVTGRVLAALPTTAPKHSPAVFVVLAGPRATHAPFIGRTAGNALFVPLSTASAASE